MHTPSTDIVNFAYVTHKTNRRKILPIKPAAIPLDVLHDTKEQCVVIIMISVATA